jgi:hypothetical protein
VGQHFEPPGNVIHSLVVFLANDQVPVIVGANHDEGLFSAFNYMYIPGMLVAIIQRLFFFVAVVSEEKAGVFVPWKGLRTFLMVAVKGGR